MRRADVLRDGVGWGLVLWLVGYILGLVLFALVPTTLIGWVILPIGVAITWWVLLTRVNAASMQAYALLSCVWTLIAVTFDYVFIVKAFGPSDGYYKLDVYVYYTLTFLLPLAAGWWKSASRARCTSST